MADEQAREQAREQLRACSADRHEATLTLGRARRRLREIRPALERAVRDADAAGIPRAEIARLAGTTRQTIYTILG